MEEDVADFKRRGRGRGHYRGRGRARNNYDQAEPRPFYNPGNQSRGRGYHNRRNNQRNDRPVQDDQTQVQQAQFQQNYQPNYQPNQQRQQRGGKSRGGGNRGGVNRGGGQMNRHDNRNDNRHGDGDAPKRNTRRGKKPKNEQDNGRDKAEMEQLASSVSKLIKKRTKFMQEADQRVVLLDKLRRNNLECAICMEKVKHHNSIWSCENCYNILHLKCAKEWARRAMSSPEAEGWRCPYCQNLCKEIPTRYYCFCGRERDPQPGQGGVSHSCDQPCGRRRQCGHSCPALCHPGPCPPCQASERLVCSCGATEAFVKCGVKLKCANKCGKLLACGLCNCPLPCHSADVACAPCERKVSVSCRCGKEEKEFSCEYRNVEWSCEAPCGELLDCGRHYCEEVCHSGLCQGCSLVPSVVKTCHCGKELIPEGARENCLAPIPSCGGECEKELPCGHLCTAICHAGACPPCPVEVPTRCRCRLETIKVRCGEEALCTRQCRAKMSCGRHQCPVVCCPDRGNKSPEVHICTRSCGKRLECGCPCEMICHRGQCRRCPNVSFDELRCHCGEAVIYPPVYCGTSPPECAEKCTRVHSCNHEVFHNCHSEENCPPCPVLMEKPCNCGAIIRTAIPCFQENVSCGQVCSKVLSCGHKCAKTCHLGECEEPGFVCRQKCPKPRPGCDHGCGRPCHGNTPCEPFGPCGVVIQLSCHCGRRHQKLSCAKFVQMKDHQKRQAQRHQRDFTGEMTIDCDAECAIQERNRRIAAALDIDQPNVSADVDVIYPESVIRFALEKPQMTVYVETNLRRMVEQLNESDEKRLEYKLDPMNKRERMFVHELSDLYSVYSTGRDIEPNRYLLLIADRGKSKIPPNSLVRMLRKNYGAKFATTNEPLAAQLPSSRLRSIRDYKGL